MAFWALSLARRVGAGATIGVSLLIVFPLLVRYESTLTLYSLDGPGSVSAHNLDFLWPLVVAVAVTLLLFAAHFFLVDPPSKQLAHHRELSIKVHGSIEAWDAESEVATLTKPASPIDIPDKIVPASTAPTPASATTAKTSVLAAVDYDWALVLITFCTDAFMNLCTAIAFGAAWMSPRLGLMVSATVVIFQFLLKLGYLAAYRGAGVSPLRSALLCLTASFFTIMGVIIGVARGAVATDANRYLFAFAEAFLWYHSLVLLLPYSRDDETATLTVFGMVALCVGFAITLVLVTVGPAGPALPLCLTVTFPVNIL